MSDPFLGPKIMRRLTACDKGAILGTMAETQFRARVRGRVQGVSFRAWTVREARALGLSGFVRNLPDGSVEVVARGEVGSVQALAKRLRDGPPAARVTDLDLDWSDATTVSGEFNLRW